MAESLGETIEEDKETQAMYALAYEQNERERVEKVSQLRHLAKKRAGKRAAGKMAKKAAGKRIKGQIKKKAMLAVMQWLVTAAMVILGNPITWIILLIALVVVVVIIMIMVAVNMASAIFGLPMDILSGAWDGLKAAGGLFTQWPK